VGAEVAEQQPRGTVPSADRVEKVSCRAAAGPGAGAAHVAFLWSGTARERRGKTAVSGMAKPSRTRTCTPCSLEVLYENSCEPETNRSEGPPAPFSELLSGNPAFYRPVFAFTR
jgi:hypothetical protein